MYLIPKNIKTKKEIFKGFGIFECIAIAISLGIGYLFSLFITQYKLKVIFFCIPPLLMFLLLLPLPNGSTALTILKKFLIFYNSKLCECIEHKNYKKKYRCYIFNHNTINLLSSKLLTILCCLIYNIISTYKPANHNTCKESHNR